MKQITLYAPHLIPELLDAIARGYDKHFMQHANGLIRCLSNPTKYYDFDEVHTDELIICSMIPATLYLIVTVDGIYKGTLLDIHDIFHH
jgi:hypothetical protein